jgi:hypothetical protein
MSRRSWALGVIVFAMSRPVSAAASAPASAAASAPAPAPASAPAPAFGFAVVAMPGASDAAWPLASAVYSDPSLRAAGIDDAHARVLCGEVAAGTDPPELRDLSDTVAALRGEDAPSRVLLDGIARRFSTRGLVVVRVQSGHATARVFLSETSTFDAATYAPDDAPALGWSGAVRSLARAFGSPVASVQAAPGSSGAPELATHDGPQKPHEAPPSSRPFYESTWFWGAIGAAALTGGVVYFATRDSSPSTIHLEVEVPH